MASDNYSAPDNNTNNTKRTTTFVMTKVGSVGLQQNVVLFFLILMPFKPLENGHLHLVVVFVIAASGKQR